MPDVPLPNAANSHSGIVDVHHHFLPPSWRQALESAGVLPPKRRGWSVAQSLEAMAQAQVGTAMLSTGQAVWRLGGDVRDAILLRTAREANEYGARLVSDYPGKFGLWASLPIANVDETLAEISYCFDILKADGVALPTNSNGSYLGHPQFAPVLQELERRKVVVFTHPSVPSTGINIVPGIVPNVVEYATDTTRLIVSLIANRVPIDYPNVRFIFSHAGGTMPFLIERIVSYMGTSRERDMGRGHITEILQKPEEGSPVLMLRGFYYDTAQTSNAVNMQALKTVVGSSQILFGSDFPYATLNDHIGGLDRCGVFDDEELGDVYRNNAAGMLPSISARG